MSTIIKDGTFTTASATGPIRWTAPIPGVATVYVLEEDYVIHIDSFAALALNTAHPSYPTYILVSESTPNAEGCGIIRWTRTFAAKPADHSDYESYVYTFPGFMGVIAYPNVAFTSVPAGIPYGREPKSESVTARILHEYFVCKTGEDYATPDLIPIVPKTKYYYSVESAEAKYLADGPADGGPYALSSTPSRTAYDAYVTAGTELVVEDSKLTRWMGNIWKRSTVYVAAQ